MFIGSLPAVSNRQSWVPIFEAIDDDTGDLIDITGAVIVLEARALDQERDCYRTALSATTANAKITLLDTGTFQAAFTRDEMSMMSAGTYEIGCTVTINDETLQYLIGTLPVLDGIVSR